MGCESCSDEMRSVIRVQNRTLRIVNRSLRRKVNQIEEHSDEVFFALVENKADTVLKELCEKAGVEFTDYDTVAQDIINALRPVLFTDGDGLSKSAKEGETLVSS